MVFSSITFLFYFLPLFLIPYFMLARQHDRNLLLLAFSLVFYAWGEPVYIFLMIASIYANFFFGRAIDRQHHQTHRRYLLALGLSYNLGTLAFFKYARFIVHVLNRLHVYVPFSHYIKRIPLPIGISFYTFQAVSYVIDVYRRKFPHETSILNLGTYISMFPQLIAGPIVRYDQIKEQLHSGEIDSSGIVRGAKLFVIGLTYKVLIADTFADTADHVFSLDPRLISTPLAWLGAVSYFFQIYFDFNGYSVMAIGIGKMLGFTFPRNFDRPYISKSITEFWQRWHISLSSWFRDYLYIPLGGNRVSPTITYRNLFTVFILCGFWHGAAVKFLAWGVFQGCFLVFERLLKPTHLKLPAVLSHLYTILVIMIGWVLFRIESVYEIFYYWGSMAGFPGQSVYMYQEKASLFIFILIVIAVVMSTVRVDYDNPPLQKQPYGAVIVYPTLCVASVILLISRTHNPFIYFRF